jgi:hypothetical protein
MERKKKRKMSAFQGESSSSNERIVILSQATLNFKA